MEKVIPYQIYGSQNSQDTDVVYFIDKMPETILERLELCKEYNRKYLKQNYTDKKINSNLAVSNNGTLTAVYKGTVDELNNALLTTYSLHLQEFQNQITHLLERDIDLKYERCSRMLLSFLTRTSQRASIKKALREDIHSKIKVLEQINLNTITGFRNNTDITELKKTFAFQLGQALALEQGKECYTKDEIASLFPELSAYLYRESTTDFDTIQTKLKEFIVCLKNRFQ